MEWKWIRVLEDSYDELKDLEKFGESFNDILRHLLNQKCRSGEATTTVLDHDQVKARLKKYDSHSRAIARLVRENISYSPHDRR